MRTLYLLAATAALLAAPSLAHTAMVKPIPLRYKTNPYTDPGRIDYTYSNPLLPDGTDYPCKGFHSEFNTAEGTAVETWPAGTLQSVGLGDGSGANHRGGSCQLSLSEDAGATFKVIKSFIGACPMNTQQTLEVEVPKEAKSGKALFAWSWFNKAGQREMYMNCAVVTITGGGGGLSGSEWPNIFTANIGGSCTTTEGIDTVFPNPGKNVVTAQGNVNLGPPAGDCGAAAGPAPPGQSVPAASSAPAVPAAGSPVATSSVAAPSSPSASPTSPAAATPASGGGEAGDPAACSCVCGGPQGYVVNIVPAAAGVSEGAMAPRTPPPKYSADADAGVEGFIEGREVAEPTCGAQRRDHLRRHGLKSRRGTSATAC